jgi:predicted branched-subunit amino acid permease
MAPSPAEISQARAFVRGLFVAGSVPAVVLFFTALGFGALARDGGLSIAQAAFMAASMFALPNQVVLVDQIAREQTLAAAALAVALAAVRLMPMTATLAPYFRGSKRRPLLELLAAHFIAITTWIEGNRRLPGLAPDIRLPYHLGSGVGISAVMLAGTLCGYALSARVPAPFAATLLFMNPLYFILSLVATSRTRTDIAAIVFGCLLAPVLLVALPGFDLLATGLIGGTLAFLWQKARPGA